MLGLLFTQVWTRFPQIPLSKLFYEPISRLFREILQVVPISVEFNLQAYGKGHKIFLLYFLRGSYEFSRKNEIICIPLDKPEVMIEDTFGQKDGSCKMM